MIMRNKKGDIAITLLVFMVLILCGATLLSFVYNSGKIQEEIINSRVLDSVYAGQIKIDFYINEAFQDVEYAGKTEFINNVGQEIAKYKEESWEFSIDKEKIEEKNDKVLVPINIKIKEETNAGKIPSLFYSYNKTFEKAIGKTE